MCFNVHVCMMCVCGGGEGMSCALCRVSNVCMYV